MIEFIIFIIVFHSSQFWLWRKYYKYHKDIWDREKTEFESMMFWPQVHCDMFVGKK